MKNEEEGNPQEELNLDQEVDTEDEEEIDYEAEFDAQYGDESPEDKDEDEDEKDEVVEPEPEPKPEPEPEPVTTDPADPYAWIDNLPEEVKTQAEALKHAADSDKGRVSAYNSRLQALQYEMDRMKAASRPVTTAEQGDQESSDASAAAPELPEEFQQLKEDFPEFADAVEAIRKHDRTEFDKIVADRLQPLEDQRAVDARSEFDSKVTAGAEEIFNTKETGIDWKEITRSNNFLSWLEQQPPSVQRAAATPDPVEALHVLGRYEDDYQHSVGTTADTQEIQTQEEQTTKADKIQKQRTKRKKDAVTTTSKPAPGDAGEGAGDYEAEFNAKWG